MNEDHLIDLNYDEWIEDTGPDEIKLTPRKEKFNGFIRYILFCIWMMIFAGLCWLVAMIFE